MSNPYRHLDDEQLVAQCRIEFRRASGPGGQHRNKVESAVRLTHLPTGLVANGSERRSQHDNRELAIERLRAKLERLYHREAPRVPTRKTRGVRRREGDSKKRASSKKRERQGGKRPSNED